MKQKLTAPLPSRTDVAVLDADPALGLTREQAQLRTECGWVNKPGGSILPSEKQIGRAHV